MVRPRPRVEEPQNFGSVKSGSFWVEYPSGLVDLTCSNPWVTGSQSASPPPMKSEGELEVDVDGGRKIRIDTTKTAIVIVDMQK
jgi:hypothetical protein